MNDLEQRILALSRAHSLFSPGDRVAAAVSGGADSMALLCALSCLRDALEITLFAAHFEHGLRGEAAVRDADFVRNWCRAHGIDCVVGSGDARAEAARSGASLEEAARTLRYAFLEGLPADRIATAHNAGDNVETVLLHLLRGTGVRGLGGIPIRRGRIVRPLLGCTRAEIEAYLAAQGVGHREDGTNADDGCVRNRLRHHVVPLLLAENPNLCATVARSCALVREEDAYLSRLAAEALAGCVREDGWSCTALRGLEPVLRRRALLGILTALRTEDPARQSVAALEALILSDRPHARRTLSGGLRAERSCDLLTVTQGPPPACPTLPLTVPGETVLFPEGWRIRANFTENSNISAKNLTTFALRCDMIAAASWSVRARQSGDTLLLPGGHRSVKRLMIDRRIPAQRRGQLPVVLCDGQPVGVLGLALSEDRRARPGEPALVLELLPL